MIDDLGACDDLIYSTLSADEALFALVGNRIYPDIAPQGAVRPYIVYEAAPGDDEDTLSRELSLVAHTYTIRAHNTGGSYVALRPIAKRVFALLHGLNYTATDGDGDTAHILCRRLRPVRSAAFPDDVRFNDYGAEYLFWVQPTIPNEGT